MNRSIRRRQQRLKQPRLVDGGDNNDSIVTKITATVIILKPYRFTLVLFCLGFVLFKLASSASEIAILIDLNYNFEVPKEKLLTLTTTGNISSNSQDYNITTSIAFVTGSSANHMETLLLDLLPSIEKFALNAQLNALESNSPDPIDFNAADIKVIHYNLDPIEKRQLESNKAQYKNLHNKFPFVEMRDFNYTAYPLFFDIENSFGEYAWKATIFEHVAKELRSSSTAASKKYSQSFLYWLDAGVTIVNGKRFQIDFRIAKKQGIYTPASSSYLKRWTMQETSDYLGLNFNTYNSTGTRICSANMVLLDLKNETVMKEVIEPWMSCSQHKECIAPEGKN
jgi:hypothetical protein